MMNQGRWVAGGLCGLAGLLLVATECRTQPTAEAAAAEVPTGWGWVSSPMLVSPKSPGQDTYFSMKDPSVVFHEGRWHLFCTVRGRERSHHVEYLSFEKWEEADAAERHEVTASAGYFCAPQVFYFEPQQRWILICQASDKAWSPEYGAAFSTTEDISDPTSWSPLEPLGALAVEGNSGLDFWVICDAEKAHLFFTTLDGRMWREETSLEEFPHGWSEPALAIEDDIFEASHTYKLRGMDRYLTIVEAQGGHGWRYYKAYAAERLDGEWTAVAATRDEAFASMRNVRQPEPRWTDSISHGELLRAGRDQRLEVDLAGLQMVFQGVLDSDREGKTYGEIPWRLGLLLLDDMGE